MDSTMDGRRRLRLALLPALLMAGCTAAEGPWHADGEGEWHLDDGLRVVRRSWESGQRSGTLCALFADPQRYRPRLLTADQHGGRRRPTEWLQDFELSAVINAAMFQPNGRSTALMIDGETVNNGYDHPSYEGYLAFDARAAATAPLALLGRDCDGFDLTRLREQYGVVLQNFRLLDCEGRPISWRDRRSYPATAVGVSETGELVFVHSGGALEMSDFASILSEQLGLRSAVFTEGGPLAMLGIRHGGDSAQLGGVGEAPSRSLPLVLGLARP